MLVEEGIYQASIPTPGPLVTTNAYLLKDGKDALLVDTAWRLDGAWDRLLGLFDAAALRPCDLSGIVITHAHPDHISYLDALQDLTGAPVLMHREEKANYEFIFGQDPDKRPIVAAWLQQHGISADLTPAMVASLPKPPTVTLRDPRWLSGGEMLPVGSMQWEVIPTPGHSPGHICLFERSRGTLITGDHVLPHETPNVSVRPKLPANPLGSYIDSLRLVQTLPVRQALPGHAGVFGDFAPLIDQLISHHDVRFGDVLAALDRGPRETFAVACEVPWVQRSMRFMQLSPWDRFLALGETIAHLECLEARGKVRRLESNGHTLWQLV